MLDTAQFIIIRKKKFDINAIMDATGFIILLVRMLRNLPEMIYF